VAIADDEAPARNRLRDLLADCAAAVPLEVVGEAANGRALLDLLVDHPADVVLLDIRMPDMDGIETARHLQRFYPAPAVIFTTAYDAYAIRAFEVHAVDYLLKPIRGQRLQQALQRARPLPADTLRDISPPARKFLSILERDRVLLVPAVDVIYFKAEQKYVTVRTAQREYLIEESLTQLEREYGDHLVRVHRNCLVTRAAIRGFERNAAAGEGHWNVLLDGCDDRIPLSRRQHHLMKDLAR